MRFNNLHNILYNDLYNISNRIKQINPNYELYFNRKIKKFLIINSANNYEICLNFDNFNQNIENILKNSACNNFESLIKSIEDNNNKIELLQHNSTKEKTTEACLECINLINKSSNISNNDINKIIGECNA